ncbi:hypothetical protein YC2023_042885 [Brassica napus]
MAAIDYIVCKESDVFMASHGGNMGCAIKAKVLKTNLSQGHSAYEGHKKLITPNKRQMLPYFLNKTMTETESEKMMKKLHKQSLGQPEIRVSKAGRDLTKYPVPESSARNARQLRKAICNQKKQVGYLDLCPRLVNFGMLELYYFKNIFVLSHVLTLTIYSSFYFHQHKEFTTLLSHTGKKNLKTYDKWEIVSCPSCKALLWNAEALRGQTSQENKQFSLCCH